MKTHHIPQNKTLSQPLQEENGVLTAPRSLLVLFEQYRPPDRGNDFDAYVVAPLIGDR
jgi:hypothetical protein